MTVQNPPEGTATVTPYLIVDGAADAIDFYKRAFGATEEFRMDAPGGTIGHASIEIGDCRVMLADPMPGSPYGPPEGQTGASLYLYVDDVDATFKKAVDAGATAQNEPADMFWGDRWGRIVDPFGHAWEVATHIEDLTGEQMAERAREAMAGAPQ